MPTLRANNTCHAEQNRHVVAINEATGFTVVDGGRSGEFAVA